MKTSFTKVPSRQKGLNAVVDAIADVHQAVIGDGDAVHRVELRRAGAFVHARERRAVVRLVPVRAPMPLVSAGVGIEHDHAPVAVAVGDEELVGGRVHGEAGGLVDVGSVVAAATRAMLADLEQELARRRELEQIGVLVAVAADPDVVLAVDVDAVLDVRPVVALAGSAPRLEKVAVEIELQDRRRRLATVRGLVAQVVVVLVSRTGPMDHPDAIVRIHRDARHLSQEPVVGEMLRPVRVGLELRNGGGGRDHHDAGDCKPGCGNGHGKYALHRQAPRVTGWVPTIVERHRSNPEELEPSFAILPPVTTVPLITRGRAA
jgi:hypothetical protein